jgi:hypothetical protein
VFQANVFLCTLIANSDQTTHHRTGGPLEAIDGMELLATPPLSIRLHQELVEIAHTASDGNTKKDSYVEELLFSLACFVSEHGPVIVPLQINVKLDAPTAGTFRI